MNKAYLKNIPYEYLNKPDHLSAILPKVPGSSTGRRVSTLLEEAALLRANQVKQKENMMATENNRGTIVQDIYEAAHLAAYGVEPTLNMKDNKVVFIFPVGEKVLHLREHFKNSYIRTQDLADQVRRLQAKARLIRK